MIEIWRSQTERPIEQELPGGGLQQIFASNDFSDCHGCVIQDDGELIGGQVIVTPDDEVTQIPAGHEFWRAIVAVDKRNDLAIRNLKAPIYRAAGLVSDL